MWETGTRLKDFSSRYFSNHEVMLNNPATHFARYRFLEKHEASLADLLLWTCLLLTTGYNFLV